MGRHESIRLGKGALKMQVELDESTQCMFSTHMYFPSGNVLV